MDNQQMDSQQTFSVLLERLEYRSSPNLLTKDALEEPIPAELESSWREAKDKLGIDAVYFVANTPVIYFKQFEVFSHDIAEFHRNIWSQSQVPLIFVILPGDIRVYNGYKVPQRTKKDLSLAEPPRLDNELGPTHQESSMQLWEDTSTQLWDRLEIFTRTAIDSGSFWRDYGDHFNKETRADQTLIANLRYIRQQLIENEPKLKPEYAHNLIGRSIFALYLQDRGVLPVGENGFFAQESGGKYLRYTDLLTSHKDTYAFFKFLRERFDGDMFPVTDEEEKAVRPEHLDMLHKLFTSDSVKGGQMLFFWAYNFEFIPIELISAIYEEFLYQEESGKDGAYYTPPMLVDFMLNQVLPRRDSDYELKLLDPACGSGIFLVEAYRRLVDRWRKANGHDPKHEELADLLKRSIFGVDIKLQALHIAAFSLYLAMLDYIEPKTIWMEVQFPPLINTNLIKADFFEERLTFEGMKFDLIVGNPPWVSKLTSHAKIYLRRRKYKVGDEQIVQAFLWHAPDFCNPQGQIALLCSSKSILFNKSHPNVAFRYDFFKKFSVRTIFDFSALRRFLFPKGIAPAMAIFYTPQQPILKSTIFYGAPKLTPLARRFAAIVIESIDLKQLPLQEILESLEGMRNGNKSNNNALFKQREIFEEDEEEVSSRSVNIWKVALWGTNYDYILLQSLSSYPSLLEVIEERGWNSGAGFIRSGSDEPQYCPWLDRASFLNAKDFTRYGIDAKKLAVLPAHALYHRGRKPSIFKAPLVLFKRGQAQRRPGAAYLDQDCTYTDAITGIAGPGQDMNLLKALTALLNSELAQYYLFLTSASWGVEREEIKASEVRTIPFPFLDSSIELQSTIVHLVDELARHITAQPENDVDILLSLPDKNVDTVEILEQELNNRIYECFGLDKQEIQHIRETVQYTIGFFNSPQKSVALQKPTIEMRKSYAETYIQAVNFYLEPVGRKLVARVSDDEIDTLLPVQFYSTKREEKIPNIQVFHPDSHIRQVLSRLRRLNIEPALRRMYHRRNFRIYDKESNVIYIAKPAERRLWTIGIALSDAGETVAEFAGPKRVLI